MGAETATTEQKGVLIGASNLGHSAIYFRQSGRDVIDLTIPGWVASPKNVENMVKEINRIEPIDSYMFMAELNF
jgi:hypothetical protein